jgi:hypothetical protein
MSRLAVVQPPAQISPAHVWFSQHLSELRSRAKVFAAQLGRNERDEAVAEIVAQTWKFVLSAARRGKLARLTPFTLVQFFGRAYVAGRRLTGTRSGDVLSVAAQRKHRLHIVSLDEVRPVCTCDRVRRLPLSDVLADGRADPPPECCRRNTYYPEILQRQRANQKARRVFAFLAATHGSGRGVDMARQLRVTPPRIVQLKQQLARCLAAEDYGPRGRSVPARHRRQRPQRRTAPPLNAGTSPAGGQRTVN